MTSRPSRQRRGQAIALKVLELRALGGSISSISEDLHITTWRTRQVLDHIGMELKHSLLTNFVEARIPLALAESLELNRIIIGKAMAIANESKDPRVKIEGLRLASQVSQSSNQMLSDSHIIAKAIQRSALVVHHQPTSPQPLEERTREA